MRIWLIGFDGDDESERDTLEECFAPHDMVFFDDIGGLARATVEDGRPEVLVFDVGEIGSFGGADTIHQNVRGLAERHAGASVFVWSLVDGWAFAEVDDLKRDGIPHAVHLPGDMLEWPPILEQYGIECGKMT